MCGRFALGRDRDHIIPIQHYRVQPNEWVGGDNFQPRNNIAPRSNAPVIRRMRGSGNGSQSENADMNASVTSTPHQASSTTTTSTTTSTATNESATERTWLQTMQWGVIPHWQRFSDETGQIKTINARGENLLEAPTGLWASLKKHKRCVVPVHGYFEWLKPQPPAPANGEKKAHFVRHKDDSKLMLFAGLWDCVKLEDAPDGQELYTFAIVTVEANKQLGWLHDRMPLILTNDDDIDTWLDNDKGWSKEVASLVKPYTGPDLECYPVPKEVGKVGTDSPSYVLPVSQRKDGIQAMFARQKAKPAASSSSSSLESQSSPSSSRLANTSTPLSSTPTTPRPSRQKNAAAQNSGEGERDVIEIRSSPPPQDPDVIDITSSPAVATPGKRKRITSPTPSPRKKPKMGAASPIKQKQQKQAAKGTAKITSFFGSKV